MHKVGSLSCFYAKGLEPTGVSTLLHRRLAPEVLYGLEQQEERLLGAIPATNVTAHF